LGNDTSDETSDDKFMELATITVPSAIPMVALVGPGDSYLRIIEKTFPDIRVTVRGNEIFAKGDEIQVVKFEFLIKELLVLLRSGQGLSDDAVMRSIAMTNHDPVDHPAEVLSLNILSNRGKSIRPKTANQKRYVEAIDENTITFGVGPAGTGKTYLAMAKAIQSLQAKQVNRIILTRPAVEAGERLGFLPGTLQEKIDPYLRPLFDALHDMIDQDSIPRLMQSGIIEIAPLAYMRGRTLNDAFIILDEAQNTSAEQMKMFLTRLGFGSKMVITGDTTQIDLPHGAQSGLKIVHEILDGVEDIAFIPLDSEDVVRNRLVGEIVNAYGRHDAGKPTIPNVTRQIRTGNGDR
jgi:phosphate starvation-inducible PhoH-like protein